MTAVFSTYQSIQAIHAAQTNFGLPEFDQIICDEAHRTTGVTLTGDDESNFVRVHDAGYIKGKKRVYMTATPRIFGDTVKKTAQDANAVLCSMDDPALFGETLFTRNFSWAVQNGLLTDYKVIVLAVDEASVSATLQKRLSDENSELVLDDATKIVGCYKALTKADLQSALLFLGGYARAHLPIYGVMRHYASLRHCASLRRLLETTVIVAIPCTPAFHGSPRLGPVPGGGRPWVMSEFEFQQWVESRHSLKAA